jgi:hypothetical protein
MRGASSTAEAAPPSIVIAVEHLETRDGRVGVALFLGLADRLAPPQLPVEQPGPVDK